MANTINEPQFLQGVQNIERAIIRGVRNGGGNIDASSFLWHRGKVLIPPPLVVELKITFQDINMDMLLSYEEIEDAWQKIDEKSELHLRIDEAIDMLLGR